MSDVNEPMEVLRCRVCEALLEAENIDFNRGIASCGFCQAIMRFDTGESAPDFEARPELAIPDKFRVEDLGDEFRIHQRWLSAKVIFLAIFATFWCGVSFFLFGGALIGGAIGVMLFMIPFLAIGFGVLYAVFCCLLNTTTISVGAGQLTVWHHPLPVLGGGSYDAGEVEQLYCEHKIHESDNNATDHYQVRALFKGGRRKTLVKSLDEPNKALFIEQQLEEHLKIRDQVVRGEIPR